MEDSETLSPIVRDIATNFTLRNGKPVLSDDVFADYRSRVVALPEQIRRSVVESLFALASKFHRLAGEAANDAITQLMLLAAEVLSKVKDMQETLANQTAPIEKAKKLLAIELSKMPVTGLVTSSPSSLFTLMMDTRRSGK